MRLTAITIPWADGDYLFDLKLGQVRALQEKTGFGCAMLVHRLNSGEYKVDDFRETILQGLIGGGMKPVEATVLVKRYVDERPAAESILPAQAVLMAWIMGAPQGKKDAPETESETTAPAGSTSGTSMESVPQSDAQTPA